MGLMSGMFLRVDIFGVTMDTYGLYITDLKEEKHPKIEFLRPYDRHWCDGNQLKIIENREAEAKRSIDFLGGGFRYFLFSPLFGEMILFD